MRKHETLFQRKIEKLLKKLNLPYINTNDIGDGVADLVIAYKGFYVECELKTEEGSQRDNQRLRELFLTSQGNIYIKLDREEKLLRLFKDLDARFGKMQSINN